MVKRVYQDEVTGVTYGTAGEAAAAERQSRAMQGLVQLYASESGSWEQILSSYKGWAIAKAIVEGGMSYADAHEHVTHEHAKASEAAALRAQAAAEGAALEGGVPVGQVLEFKGETGEAIAAAEPAVEPIPAGIHYDTYLDQFYTDQDDEYPNGAHYSGGSPAGYAAFRAKWYDRRFEFPQRNSGPD